MSKNQSGAQKNQYSTYDLDELTDHMEEWLKTQQQLPQLLEKPLLKRFLYAVHGDVHAAKRLIELNYALRNKHAHIFLNRDPNDASTQQLLQVADLLPLPGLTVEKHKLLLYRLSDFDAEKFNFVEGVKVFFMMADCRFALEDDAGVLSAGEIPIFDMAGFSLRHLTKTIFSALRIYMKFVQEAHPVRLKAIHVLNCPTYLDKVLTIVKPLIKSEVFKMITFHLPNSDTAFQILPRELFPEEYGGKAGKVSELKELWMKLLAEKREYLMDEKRWKMNKPLKNKKSSKSKDVHKSDVEICSNLRTLEID